MGKDLSRYCSNVNLKPGALDFVYFEIGFNTYICNLTGERCVGASEGVLTFLSDRLSKDVIERCPSRVVKPGELYK